LDPSLILASSPQKTCFAGQTSPARQAFSCQQRKADSTLLHEKGFMWHRWKKVFQSAVQTCLVVTIYVKWQRGCHVRRFAWKQYRKVPDIRVYTADMFGGGNMCPMAARMNSVGMRCSGCTLSRRDE
jgi:hypothetical protein